MQPHALTPVRMLNKPSTGSQITGWMHGNTAHFKPTLRQNAAAQATGELKTVTHAVHLFQNRCAAPLRETHKDEETMLCASDSVTRKTWCSFNVTKILQNPLFHQSTMYHMTVGSKACEERGRDSVLCTIPSIQPVNPVPPGDQIRSS